MMQLPKVHSIKIKIHLILNQNAIIQKKINQLPYKKASKINTT